MRARAAGDFAIDDTPSDLQLLAAMRVAPTQESLSDMESGEAWKVAGHADGRS